MASGRDRCLVRARGLGTQSLGEPASFDPLTLKIDADVRAISANAWFSLGRHGVGLHFERRPGIICEVTVLARAARGKRWEVSLDGRTKERDRRWQ